MSKSYVCINTSNKNIKTDNGELHETIKRKLTSENQVQSSKLYTMCQLNFYLVEGEGIIINENTVEFRLLLDNQTEFDWPDNLYLKGKDNCKITKGFNYLIPQKVKSCSVKGIKFTLTCPVSVYKLENEVAVFELFAINEQENKKYFSDEIKAPLKYKKSYSLFNLCSSFIK